MFRYALLLLLPTMIFAPDKYEDIAKEMFAGVDANSDGKITVVELHQNFEVFDTDNDGLVTRQEYVRYFALRDPNLEPIANQLFTLYDFDQSDGLQLHDFDNHHKLMDSNSNGDVTEDEFVRYWSVLLASIEPKTTQ